MAFATFSDLEVRVNLSFTEGQKAQASALLAEATSAIQAETGQTIELVEDGAVTLTGNWGSTLVLPQFPVVEITSVAIDDTALTSGTGYTWDGQRTLYRGRRSNMQNVSVEPWPADVRLYWGSPSAQIDITYSHGFETIPPVIAGVCMAMAWREMQDPSGTQTSKTVGPFSETRSSGTGSMAMTSQERRAVRKALGL